MSSTDTTPEDALITVELVLTHPTHPFELYSLKAVHLALS